MAAGWVLRGKHYSQRGQLDYEVTTGTVEGMGPGAAASHLDRHKNGSQGAKKDVYPCSALPE